MPSALVPFMCKFQNFLNVFVSESESHVHFESFSTHSHVQAHILTECYDSQSKSHSKRCRDKITSHSARYDSPTGEKFQSHAPKKFCEYHLPRNRLHIDVSSPIDSPRYWRRPSVVCLEVFPRSLRTSPLSNSFFIQKKQRKVTAALRCRHRIEASAPEALAIPPSAGSPSVAAAGVRLTAGLDCLSCLRFFYTAQHQELLTGLRVLQVRLVGPDSARYLTGCSTDSTVI